MEQNNSGSITKGVLLNIGLNLILSIVMISMTNVSPDLYGHTVNTVIISGFFLALLAVGIVQIIHIVPLIIYYKNQNKNQIVKGMLLAGGITLLLWVLALSSILVFYKWG